MIEDIDRLNQHKFHTTSGLTTTEQVRISDIMIFTVLAAELKAEIKLPANDIFGSHFILDYEWGSIIVMCELSKN